MPYHNAWLFPIIGWGMAIALFIVLRTRNPKLVTLTIGPLFLFMVALGLGVTRLYLMGTLMLSVCAVCHRFAVLSLHGTRITRAVTSPVSRGDGVEIAVEVVNNHWLPKLFLRVRCPLPEWLRAEHDSFVVPGLWPGMRFTYRIDARAAKRGCYALEPVELIGADPLGVFSRVKRVPLPTEVVVFPKPDDAAALDLWGADFLGTLPARRALHAAQALDFRSLRDYVPGDDTRAIDWKATARLSRLTVIEFEPTQVDSLIILLDNRPEVQAGKGEDSTLERAISLAAGHLMPILDARGAVSLRALRAKDTLEVSGHGREDAPRFLEALARIEMTSGSLADLAPGDSQGRTVLLLTPSTGPEVPSLVRRITAAGGRPVVVLWNAADFTGGTSRGGESAAAMAAERLRAEGARVLMAGAAGTADEGMRMREGAP